MPKGYHHSAEARRKISEAHKGKHLSEEARRKISEANRGRHRSEEARRKISEAHKGTHYSEEARRKNSEAHKGKHHSAEARRKISEAHKGRTMSENLKEVWTRMRRYGYYIQVNGQPFKSIAEVARTYNLDYNKLRLALKEYRDLAGNPDYEERKDLEGYKDLSEFGLEYDYETSTIFKRRWGEYLDKELEERPYRQEEIVYIALKYKEKN